MNKLRNIPYAVLTAGLLAAGGASAQSMSSIDGREASQQDRIEAGRRDGSLTRGEARRLEQGEQRIERYEAHARADGVVTSGERQRLDGMLDRESRQITRERTDGQRAGGFDHDGRDGRDRGRGDHDGRDNDRGNHTGWDRGNHNGWDNDRGNQTGWDRGNHDGRDNDRGNHTGWDRGNRNGRDNADANRHGWGGSDSNHSAWGTRPSGGDQRHDRHDMTADRRTTTSHDGMSGRGDVNCPERGSYAGQPQHTGQPQASSTPTPRSEWNGRGSGFGQQTTNSHAGWNVGANGGTRGQAQTQPQPRPQPQAPALRQAAYNPGAPARTMPAAATTSRPAAQTRTASTGGPSRTGGGR